MIVVECLEKYLIFKVGKVTALNKLLNINLI